MLHSYRLKQHEVGIGKPLIITKQKFLHLTLGLHNDIQKYSSVPEAKTRLLLVGRTHRISWEFILLLVTYRPEEREKKQNSNAKNQWRYLNQDLQYTRFTAGKIRDRESGFGYMWQNKSSTNKGRDENVVQNMQ